MRLPIDLHSSCNPSTSELIQTIIIFEGGFLGGTFNKIILNKLFSYFNSTLSVLGDVFPKEPIHKLFSNEGSFEFLQIPDSIFNLYSIFWVKNHSKVQRQTVIPHAPANIAQAIYSFGVNVMNVEWGFSLTSFNFWVEQINKFFFVQDPAYLVCFNFIRSIFTGGKPIEQFRAQKARSESTKFQVMGL